MNPPNKLTIFTILKLILFWEITTQEIMEEFFSEPLLETDRAGILKQQLIVFNLFTFVFIWKNPCPGLTFAL